MTTPGSAGQEESGAEFRRKFEALQAERDALKATAATLAQRAFKFVQPGDFEGVEPNKYVEHAERVQSAREVERESIFAEMAASKGIDVSALKQDQAQKPPADDAASRIASLGELRGTPPAGPDRFQGLEGRALLEAVYAAEEASGH